jgi:Domain of unknown function (DUF4372)/Transposase DDE domain
MNSGRTVFAQLIEHLPHKEFQKCVARYRGNRYAKNFSCWDQYLAMAFAQLTYRESLRDIETCLGAVGGKLYHMGFRTNVARSTLADANESRDWRIYADFAQKLIATARPLYARDPMGVDLDQSLYALDSTTIDLCLALFPWARFRRHKAAVKMHTLLDLRGNIPAFVHITDGKVHDVNVLDQIVPEAGAFYVMDRGYIDFERLFVLTLSAAFFVVRTKSNVLLQRRYSHPVDKSTGVRSDQTVILSSFESASVYPDPLRKVSYYDAETGKRLKFLTNNFALPALTIAQIYKQRWQVELFQMDQAAPADQGLLRHQRERGENANLDRGVGLCAGGDRAQTAGAGGQSVPDSTDSQPHALRENADFMRPADHRPGRHFHPKRQSTDFVRVLTGQQWNHIIGALLFSGDSAHGGIFSE